MPLQWRNELWQSLEDVAGKRRSRALTASEDRCTDKECLFSGVTNYVRVWRKVPESDVQSVISTQTLPRALTASEDRCAEIRNASSAA